MKTAFISICILISFGLSNRLLLADQLMPINFTLFAEHPEATVQPTERGQTIRDVEYFEGQLYTGYGDWGTDTGPIEIRALDPTTATFSASLLTFETEAVSHFRGLNGSLYTTTVDPSGLGPQPGGYAVGNASHQWSAVVPTLSGSDDALEATHIFDINQLSSSDVFMTGSIGKSAIVWQSSDGGQTFEIASDDVFDIAYTPPEGSPQFAFSRYVGAAAYDGNLHIQRVDFNVDTPQNDVSLVFDGSEWSSGPDLIMEADGFMSKPYEFGDELLYLSSDLSDGYLYRFDGTTAQHALPGVIHDFQVLDEAVLALASGGELLVTGDLTNWTSLGHAPLDARSIELVGDTIFVGTTSGTILSAGGFDSLPGVPEPGTGAALLAFCVGCLMKRRNRQHCSAMCEHRQHF